MIRARISWLRFLGLGLGETMPKGKTIRLFRENLKKAGAFEMRFKEFGEHLCAKGCESRSGRIADSTGVSSPRQGMDDPTGHSASSVSQKYEHFHARSSKASIPETAAFQNSHTFASKST